MRDSELRSPTHDVDGLIVALPAYRRVVLRSIHADVISSGSRVIGRITNDNVIPIATIIVRAREGLGDKAGVANTLGNLGVLHLDQGNYLLAMECFQKSLTIRDALGDKDGTAVILNNIGAVHATQGNYDLALDYFQKSLAICEALGNKRMIATNLDRIANTYSWRGDAKLT